MYAFIARVAYRNPNGIFRMFSQGGCRSVTWGDSVPIAYSRIDPERARIDTLWFSHRWAIGGIIVGLAIFIRALAGADLKQN
jgi:hypothetical protein